MFHSSRTTLRELKKRYLNILKKCLLANLSLILLSSPAMAEPTTYTAEDIYERLTNGQGVTVDGQIIDTPIQAGVFTGRLYFSRNADYPSNVTFSDGSIFKVGFHVSDSTTVNLGKSYFDGASLVNWGGKVNFSGDVIFENINGHAVRNQVDTNGVLTLSFKKAEFYNNTLLNSAYFGIFHVYGASSISFEGDAIFGKYVLDENGNYTFDENGNLLISSNKSINLSSSTPVSQGGAIRSQANNMTIDGQGIFIGNEAQAQTVYGGALFNGLVSYITFNNIAKFELNKAISTTGNSYGGAIFNTSANSLTFNDFVSFGGYLKDKDGNLILDNEGKKISVGNMAISKETLDAEGNVIASGNAYGGAIGAGFDNAGVLNFKEVDFIANKVHSESAEAYGGAISTLIEPKNSRMHSIKISGSSLFQDNIAQGATKAYGGAIYNEGGIVLSDVTFLGNKALSSEGEAYGGAITNMKYQKENGEYLHATVKMNDISLFQDNLAQGATKAYGGAIYNESGAKNNDGTIKTAGVSFSDVSFIGNKAESTTTNGEAKGGAIYNKGIMQFNGEALFKNNEAKHGGAIYNNGTIEFNKKAEFIGNKSSSSGGAIYSNGIITFQDKVEFIENGIGKNGGAIEVDYGGKIIFKDVAKFEGNKGSDGGAIHNWSQVVFEKDVSFINNQGGVGGAMHNRWSAKFLGHATFIGNSGVYGSGYHAEGASTTEFNTARFEGNSASGGGSLSGVGKVTFNGKAEFINNTASWQGGAIRLEGGVVTFKDGVEFSGNRAPYGNDVYFNGVGTINFGAVPEDITQLSQTKTGDEIVEGGFASKDAQGIVNKYSNSTLTFLDSSDNQGFTGTFNQYIGKTVAKSESFLGGTNNILGGELETHGNTINYTANIGDETRTASLIHHSGAVGENQTSLTSALQIGVGSTALFDSIATGVQANYALTDDVVGAGTAQFKDAHLTLGQNLYEGTYEMGENVTLNMQDGEEESVRFEALKGTADLKIDADIVKGANGLELVTDQIIAGEEAILNLKLTDVLLSEDALDNGLNESYTATVMTGGTLTYGSEKGLVATDVYSYEVTGKDNQITIKAIEFNEESDVMKSIAEYDGDASFNMMIGKTNEYEMQSDVTMTANEKTIVGNGKEESILTAKKITVDGATLNVEEVTLTGAEQVIEVSAGKLNVTDSKVEQIVNESETMLSNAEVVELENQGELIASGSTITELMNEQTVTVTGGKVAKATNKGELSVTGAKITELMNEGEARVSNGELGTVINAKGVKLELMAGTRAETVTNKGELTANGSVIMGASRNEGEMTLEGVTVSDLLNEGKVVDKGSTIEKLVNEKDVELTGTTVKDLTNQGTLTAQDLTIKGDLKGEGIATMRGNLIAEETFRSENKIISDCMVISSNVQKMELSDLEIKEGTTLDIGTREVTAKDVTVGKEATLQVTLNGLNEFGTMAANQIEAGEGAGVHLVLGEKFEGGVFDVFKGTKGAGDLEVVHNNLYNVIEVEEGKYSFMSKNTEELKASLGATKEEVTIAEAMTQGTSSHETFARMQSEVLVALQSLDTQTVEKAKKALKAVGTSEQSSAQSVSTDHVDSLANIVQGEMQKAGFGRSGGEEEARAKVYIKGLYDKTKSTMGDGFKARSQGAVLGIQSEVTDALTLGVGYATSQTTAKEDLRRTEVDTNTGFISAHYQPNAWWLSGLATYSRGQYDEEKQVLSSTGKANYDVDSWGVQVMTGYDIKLADTVITPEVGLRYLAVKQEGYTDTLGTTVEATSSDYLTAIAGIKTAWDLGKIRPSVGINVGYDVISDDVSALNTLANGASYTVNSEALDRLSVGVTTGIEAKLNDRTTLKLEYNGSFRKEYTDHSGMLKLEWRF